MKKKFAMLMVTVLLVGTMTGCGASWDRAVKDVKSEFDGGLDRTITLVDTNGDVVKTYEGKFDIESGEGAGAAPKIKFEKDGQRIIIYDLGATTAIVEEKIPTGGGK